MINKTNKIKGQTALILILLSAAALIFLSITLNWGRISQTKNMLSIAADETAALLASDAASYGEQEKQTNLKDKNYLSAQTGTILSFIMVIISIAILVIATGGAGLPAASSFLIGVAVASAALSITTLVLQVAVIQPGITENWNKLQKNQTPQQQFFEEGISTALQGSATDSVNITDYFDLNANGQFGIASGDTVSRLGFYYTDRLKMLHQSDLSQVVFYDQQLSELMNGETCAQNYADSGYNIEPATPTSVPLNPSCIDPTSKLGTEAQNDYCALDPNDPACEGLIPSTVTCAQNVNENKIDPDIPINPACVFCNANPSDPTCQLVISNVFSFQLNDACTDSNPGLSGYNPYCDPCCQANPPASCSSNCELSNPFVTAPGGPFPYLYDSSYQEYANGISFLDQLGRDMPMAVDASGNLNPQSPPGDFKSLVKEGNFPNGAFPFLWYANYYSPEVFDINPTTNSLLPSQDHWCVAGVPMVGGTVPPFSAPVGFPVLTQLEGNLANPPYLQYNLPYNCQGQDCCVNYLPATLTITNGFPTAPAIGPSNTIDFMGVAPPNLNGDLGETGDGEVNWLPGDNQMCYDFYHCADGTQCAALNSACADGSQCSANYNGATSDLPDGTCELGKLPGIITVDKLDDLLHTLSDFVVASNNFLSTDVGTLSSTFHTWYPQAAEWIAPACGGSANVPYPACNEPCDDGTQCTGGECQDGTACGGVDGRLLQNVYDPYTGTDYLKDWGTLIQNWLNTPSNPGAWCVPAETDQSMNYNGQATAENSYIATQGNTVPPMSSWPNDLPHVIACLDYNASQPNPLPTPVSALYLTCLDALMVPNACSPTLPTTCPPAFGPNACNLNDTTSYAYWLSSNSANLGSLPGYYQCLSALTTSAICPTTFPTQCNVFGSPPIYNGNNGSTSCQVYEANSYAHWISDMINTSPINNYTSCQNYLAQNASKCPASIANTPCDLSILGRSLLDPKTEPEKFSGSCVNSCPNNTECVPDGSGSGKCSNGKQCNISFSQWVNDSLTLFEDEQPKFALRAAFLTDYYSRALTMQNIFAQGDNAFHNFFKSCTGCAGDTPGNNTCGTVKPNQCADGSACGATDTCDDGTNCPSSGPCPDGSICNQCAYGGPAAQLIWLRSQGNATRTLPNSVIYGWRDKPPTSSTGGCVEDGARIGCAHIVKVTALAAGRNQINGQPYIAQSLLPWINTTTSGSFLSTVRKFILTQRDGYVFVSIRRWDEDHSTPVSFPNGRTLWQFLLHNPSVHSPIPQGNIFASCDSTYSSDIPSPGIGFGLLPQTVEGLIKGNVSSSTQDLTNLQYSFMLNDDGTGTVDGNGKSDAYKQCVTNANALLAYGTESHACAEYIASFNASGPSCAQAGPGDSPSCHQQDYSMKFVDCSTLDNGQSLSGNP